jgi:hypothetical protein
VKTTLFLFASVLLVSAPLVGAQGTTPQAPATYNWHAELVAFDQGARTITLRTRAVGSSVANQIKGFKAGERVLLFWSGFDNSANGIREVIKYDMARSMKESFLLPVELVTPMLENESVTFKLRSPASADAVLKAVKLGDWVTITSRQRPSGDADAVVAVKAYVMPFNPSKQ